MILKVLLLGCAMGLGYYLDRAGRISRQGLQSLSVLVLNYLLPCLTFYTLIEHFPAENLKQAWILPLTGFLTFSVGLFIAFATAWITPLAPVAKRTYLFLCAVNNYGYMPLPLIYMLYGEAGAALLFFQNLGCHIFFWIIGIRVLSGGGSSPGGFRIIFNNNFYALIAGLLLAVLGWQRFVPGLVLEFTQLLGLGAIPLVLIVIGSTLAELDLRQGMPWRLIGQIGFVRLILAPALALGMIYVLPMPRDYKIICTIVALMPCASSSPIFAKDYGGDKILAAQAVLSTTLASLVAIPLFLAFLLD